jgi:hypothetical protein
VINFGSHRDAAGASGSWRMTRAEAAISGLVMRVDGGATTTVPWVRRVAYRANGSGRSLAGLR